MVILQKKICTNLYPYFTIPFILAQLYFVIAIVKEKNINTWFVVVFILDGCDLFFAYRKPQRLHIEHEKEFHIMSFFFLFSWQLLPSFIFFSIISDSTPYFQPDLWVLPEVCFRKSRNSDSKNWPIVIYCGAFRRK